MTVISYVYYNLGTTDYDTYTNKTFWKMECTDHRQQEHCMVDNFQYPNLLSAIKSGSKSLDIAKSIAFSAFGKTMTKSEKYLGT